MKATKYLNSIVCASLVLMGTFMTTKSFAQDTSMPQKKAMAATMDMDSVRHKFETVDGLEIFYREAGDPFKTILNVINCIKN